MQIPGTNLRDTTAGRTAGELWRLDEHRREGIAELDQTKEHFITQWTRNVNDDLASLTQQIEAVRQEISREERAVAVAPPPPYSERSTTPSSERSEQLRQRAKDLDRMKQVKLASYGMYVNSAAMIFGGIAAGMALLPLLACCVM